MLFIRGGSWIRKSRQDWITLFKSPQ
jgi:hypothetical protein